MKPLLITLSFCFALFFSTNSNAYNEAMCILIKQEMQQYSNDQTSSKYRKAARDYRKNCNKPKQILSQTKPVINKPTPSVIVTQPQSKPVKPESLEKQNQSNSETQNEQALELTTEQKQSISNAVDAQSEQIKINLDSSKLDAEQAAIAPATINNQSSNATLKGAAQEPINPPVKAPVDKPIPVVAPQSITEPASSLLLPSFILILVVLIVALVMMRLRRIKKANSTTRANNTDKEKIDATQSQSAVTISTDTKTDEQRKSSLNEDEVISKSDAQLSEHSPADVEKPAINTAEFEAAAKETLARIKDANTFNEPKIRSFDPNAKPVKIKRKHNTQVTKPQNLNNEAEQPVVEPGEHGSLPIETNQPKTLLHEPNHSDTKNDLTISAHDFKEPEVRTYDPNAALPTQTDTTTKIAKQSTDEPQTGLKPEQNTAQLNEPQPELKKEDKNNPFANLSLDESWDPNSTKKPIVEPKKQGPKSQALIEAEERAKKLQTKE